MTDTFVMEIQLRAAGPDAAGQAAARRREPEARRTGSKVRRHSRRAGNEKGLALDERQKAATLRHYDELSRSQKLPGRRWGGGGAPSRHDRMILDYLLFLAVKEAGRVYPTIKAIASAVGCTTRSVVGGLKRLRASGFLRWDRRFVETGRKGLRGPQVEQTSNFYYLHLKTAAQELLEAWKAGAAKKRRRAEEQAQAAAQEAAKRQQAKELELEEWRRKSPALQRGEATMSAGVDRRRDKT